MWGGVAYGTRMTREGHRVRFGGSKRQTNGGRDQPRPALGLRPWFALLRRARSLRRFAFAIVGGSVPGGQSYRSVGTLMLVGESWRSPPIVVATSFVDRLVGIRRAGTGGLLLRCSSVHAVGVQEPLRIIHLGRDGTVECQDLLTAGRRVRARGAWILELPLSTSGPDPGTHLVPLLSPML